MYEQKIIENLREFSAEYQYEDQKLSETCFRAADAIEELQKENENISQNFEVLRQINKIQVEKISIYEGVLPKWISVEERLPEESYDGFSDDVLLLIEDPDGDTIWRDSYVGYYLYDACSDETGWWVKMTCDCTKVGEHKHGGKIYKANEYVTHWMPLPEPPKEET